VSRASLLTIIALCGFAFGIGLVTTGLIGYREALKKWQAGVEWSWHDWIPIALFVTGGFVLLLSWVVGCYALQAWPWHHFRLPSRRASVAADRRKSRGNEGTVEHRL
jgi:uncharacterized BrkB/YihY/UPF0761 family membrane protein